MDYTGHEFTVDHIIPESKGGASDFDNLCFCPVELFFASQTFAASEKAISFSSFRFGILAFRHSRPESDQTAFARQHSNASLSIVMQRPIAISSAAKLRTDSGCRLQVPANCFLPLPFIGCSISSESNCRARIPSDDERSKRHSST
jgi:hypothetical protein